MIGSVKRRFSAKTKTSCEATLSYREAKRYFTDHDKMRAAMKKDIRKAERKQAKKEIEAALLDF